MSGGMRTSFLVIFLAVGSTPYMVSRTNPYFEFTIAPCNGANMMQVDRQHRARLPPMTLMSCIRDYVKQAGSFDGSKSLLYQNRETYASILDRHIKEADNSTHASKQLHLYSQPERVRIAATLWTHPSGQHDLVYPFDPQQAQDREELVLNLQGYVMRANLPPITSSGQLTKNPLSAKQSIVLTGLGSEVFDKNAKAMIEIRSRFAAHLPDGALETWKPLLDEDFICVELSNRYLTPDRLAHSYDPVPLDMSVDPFGLLRDREGGKRTEDNVVLYYERVPQMNGTAVTYKYMECQPILIKVGHLVEAQVSFCAVPISKGRFLMLSKLRSICILDQQVYKDLNDITFEALKTSVKADNRKVKRKVGYDEEVKDAEDTANALKKMHLGRGDMERANVNKLRP